MFYAKSKFYEKLTLKCHAQPLRCSELRNFCEVCSGWIVYLQNNKLLLNLMLGFSLMTDSVYDGQT
jgi:hypothetical protein